MRFVRLAILVDAFPKLSETFVVSEAAALRALGHDVRVEARVRPTGAALGDGAGLPAAYAFEQPLRTRALALALLAARHPLRCLRDLLGRRAWSRLDAVPLRSLAPAALRLRAARVEHLHAHFAGGAALDALRLSRLLDVPWSVIGHGWDVFQEPRDLEAKLRAADLVLAPCVYTARHLERAAPGVRARVVVMGVDPGRFTRRAPHPAGRTVAAVGRLVPKKGFADLLDALARIEVDRAWIVGDGPLRGELEGRERVRVVGRVPHDEVPRHLAAADVVCAPSLLEPFGQSILEAMACGRTVVATRLGGPPEFVPPEAGILVDPLDIDDLSRALEAAAVFPSPNEAARAAAAEHDVKLQAERVEAILERATAAGPRA
jgi:glycosyltransferase involved in cell wall biosynthesis